VVGRELMDAGDAFATLLDAVVIRLRDAFRVRSVRVRRFAAGAVGSFAMRSRAALRGAAMAALIEPVGGRAIRAAPAVCVAVAGSPRRRKGSENENAAAIRGVLSRARAPAARRRGDQPPPGARDFSA